MTYRLLLFILVLLVSINDYAQNKKQNILQIDDHFFTKEEFQNIYQKNNSNLAESADVKTPAGYMDLFINFKLKVLEAERLGYDTLKSFKDELKGYRKELAQPYLTAVKYDQKMLETAYYRTVHERKVSHILINVPEGADTLEAYQRIMEIRKEIEEGADFNEMAFQYSGDPSAKQNRGKLGYFAAFMMVFPFEDAAYKTPVGEVSMPVRTRFGYHLIKVEDERESKGQMRVAHIMKRLPPPQNATAHGHTHVHSSRSPESLKNEIDSLYQLLMGGADFGDLAQKYSDDQYSARNGGKLQAFYESRMVPSFAKAAFALENDGDMSPVIKTPYGWHIIKRLEHIPAPEFEEIKSQLTENIKKNPQISKHSRDIFISELKKEYGFKLNEENKTHLNENITIDLRSHKIIQSDKLDTALLLFSFDTKKYTIGNFISFQNKNGGLNSKAGLSGKIEEYAAGKLIELEDSRLEEKYPEFGMLMQEYHDGILLFNISEKMVWNKASEDTLALKDFYEQNKDKYMDEEKFRGWIISCRDFEVRSRIDQVLDQDDNFTRDELMEVMNTDNPGAVSITEGIYKKGDNPVVDYYVWDGAEPDNFDELLSYVRGDKLPPAPKVLEESRGLHVADYQNSLEKKWIDELREKYKIKVNKKMLRSIPSLK